MGKRNYLTLVFTLFLIVALSVEYYYEKGGDFLNVSSNMTGRELPIYRVNTQKKQIAISIDASWSNRNTSSILEILAKHQVKASFFVTGTFVDTNPEDIKRILAEGHDLGNHTQSHIDLSSMDSNTCKQELLQVHNKITALTGIHMKLFRPPYGAFDNQVIQTARSLGYQSIHWTIDSHDWKDYDAIAIQEQILSNPNLKSGAILLFQNSGKHTAEALDSLLTTLKEQGYQFVPVSDLIYQDHCQIDADGSQSSDS